MACVACDGIPAERIMANVADGLTAPLCIRHFDEAQAGDGYFCLHASTRRLYDQRPPSEGRKLVAVRRLCEACGEVLPLEMG